MSKEVHQNLVVSPAPHLLGDRTTKKIMGYVIIALIPNFIVGAYLYGSRVIVLTLLSVLSCIIFEILSNLVMQKKQTINDLSAVVTGLIFVFTLPVGIDLWKVVFGSFVAIVIVKQLFGGVGQNFVNPAITARVVLLVSFPSDFVKWEYPHIRGTEVLGNAVYGPSPLDLMGDGGNSQYSFLEMFLGFFPGAVGEISAFAILVGAGFLLWKKVINPIIPLCYLGTVAILGFVLSGQIWPHLFTGGIILGAFFIATDYVTSPKSVWGKVVFGIGCGLATMMVRFAGYYTDGMIFAILIMNVLSPQIDNFFQKRRREVTDNG